MKQLEFPWCYHTDWRKEVTKVDSDMSYHLRKWCPECGYTWPEFILTSEQWQQYCYGGRP